MNKIKIIALALSAAIFTGCTAGCSKNKVSDKNKSSDKISSDTNDPTETPSHVAGELITPPEDSEEYDLGSYRISDSGIKLYYEDSEYPAELVTALEKYFTSFQTGDYAAYEECIYPLYVEYMQKFLQENYQYGLDESFNSQCENLNANMGGSFEVTRIKVEKPIEGQTEEVGADEFLNRLDGFFDDGFGDKVKAESDGLRYMTFSVMAKDSDGIESLLVEGFYILFAEKDGKYYTFG